MTEIDCGDSMIGMLVLLVLVAVDRPLAVTTISSGSVVVCSSAYAIAGKDAPASNKAVARNILNIGSPEVSNHESLMQIIDVSHHGVLADFGGGVTTQARLKLPRVPVLLLSTRRGPRWGQRAEQYHMEPPVAQATNEALQEVVLHRPVRPKSATWLSGPAISVG